MAGAARLIATGVHGAAVYLIVCLAIER